MNLVPDVMFTLQSVSLTKGGIRTSTVVVVDDNIFSAVVEEHTNQAESLLLSGNPFPLILNYIPRYEPPAVLALKNASSVVDMIWG